MPKRIKTTRHSIPTAPRTAERLLQHGSQPEGGDRYLELNVKGQHQASTLGSLVGGLIKQRWTCGGSTAIEDGRKGARRVEPANKLSEEERARILEVVNSPEFASQPPSQIVPTLIDRGEYLASESTMYRVMKAAAQQHHRGRTKKPGNRTVTSHCATEPNRLWSWDITWLPTAVKGLYYYWYMVLDVYSRKIVGHEVHVAESADLAALLMRKASLAEGLAGRQVVLHSDNGSAMRGATIWPCWRSWA